MNIFGKKISVEEAQKKLDKIELYYPDIDEPPMDHSKKFIKDYFGQSVGTFLLGTALGTAAAFALEHLSFRVVKKRKKKLSEIVNSKTEE